MIVELKKEIESKFGKTVKNRGDCEMIANSIMLTLNIEISYNTIRRLYELAPYTKPNSKTLNTLAQFVGYKDYFHFTQNHRFQEKTKLFQITYKLIHDENEFEILELVKKTNRSSEGFIDFITLLVRELYYKHNYSLINEIFYLKEMDYSNFSYSELLSFGNSIGLLLRKQNRVPKKLTENNNFLNCIYLTFVDYSSLNSYYGSWANYLRLSKTDDDIALFSYAVLQFKNFLNQTAVKQVDAELVYSKNRHPILCSRLLALQLLSKNKFNVADILPKYYKVHSKSNYSTDYSYELYTTSILTKNIEVMRFLIEKSDLSIEFLYQRHHLNSFYLMSAFYHKLINNKVEARHVFRRFSMNECHYSYEEYIHLFYLIYLFHDSKVLSEKNQITIRYNSLSKKLNHPYFSEGLMLNYFM